MTCFMCHHFNIIISAVKIGKYKGYFVICKLSAVTTACFSFLAENVHQIVFIHDIYKFGSFIGKFVIEFFSSFENIFCRTLRFRVAVTKSQSSVCKCKGIFKSRSFSLFTIEPFCNGNNIFYNSLSEFFYVMFIITVSVHLEIAKLYKIFIAEFNSFLMSEVYEFIKNFIKFSAVFTVKFAFCKPCGTSLFIICRLLVWEKL